MTHVHALDELFRSYLDLRWHLDPVDATGAGVAAHDDRLGDFRDEAVAGHVAALRAIENALEATSVDTLDDEIDRTALLNEIRVTAHRFTNERPHIRNPDFWVSHVLEGLYLLLARRDRPAAHRARAALARLQAIPVFLDHARASLVDCPTVFVDTAMNVIEGGMLLVDHVVDALGAGDDAFAEARSLASAALGSFATFLTAMPPSDAPYAVGEEAFGFRLRFEHGLLGTASDLWAYGERLVQEVEAELAELGDRIDATTTWPELVDRLRQDHPQPGELVAAYRDEMERARDFVERRSLVPVPAGDLDVIETPPFLLPLIPFAAYQPPGAFSEDRTGLFYVSPPSADLPSQDRERMLRDHCRYELASTALHEAYPGHHLQFLATYSQPRAVRRIVSTPLTYEGWALYCEEMMGEEGFYQTLEEQFFQKLALLWRAVRIVLDVGLHTRELSFESAVQMLVDRVHFDPRNAEAEVRRYCAYPGYQLCYAVGRRDLMKLRHDFRRAAGDTYTLRGFHDAVLSYGGLPPTLMRWGMGLDA